MLVERLYNALEVRLFVARVPAPLPVGDLVIWKVNGVRKRIRNRATGTVQVPVSRGHSWTRHFIFWFSVTFSASVIEIDQRVTNRFYDFATRRQLAFLFLLRSP